MCLHASYIHVCVHACMRICAHACMHGCILCVHTNVDVSINHLQVYEFMYPFKSVICRSCICVQFILIHSICFVLSLTLNMLVTLRSLVIDAIKNILNLNLNLIEYARANTVILPSITQSLKYCPLSLTHFDPIEAIPSLGLITGRRERPGLSGSRNKTVSLCFLIIILSGDVQTNPGPIKYPCGTCQRPVASNHRAMGCDLWNVWVHIKCCGVTPKQYEYFQAQGDNSSWLCPTCTDKQSNTSTSSESSVDSDSSGPDQTHVSHTPPAQGKQFERVKIAVLNTASIKGRKKAGEFKAYIESENPDIVIASKINLTSHEVDSDFLPSGYLAFRDDKCKTKQC